MNFPRTKNRRGSKTAVSWIMTRRYHLTTGRHLVPGPLLIIIDVSRTLYKLETRLSRSFSSPACCFLLLTSAALESSPERHPEPASQPPPRPPLALQPRGRRKLLEFSKSDVQDIVYRRGRKGESKRWGERKGLVPGQSSSTPQPLFYNPTNHPPRKLFVAPLFYLRPNL